MGSETVDMVGDKYELYHKWDTGMCFLFPKCILEKWWTGEKYHAVLP